MMADFRSHEQRMQRARCALEGLSVGDAFGEGFFSHRRALEWMWQAAEDGLSVRDLDPGPTPWRWTDDTAMAIAILLTLDECRGVDEGTLARHFAEAYTVEPRRGYGAAMHRLLPQLRKPDAWRMAPRELFGSQGSFGNGAAMRVAPVGAYFAGDLEAVVEHARRSAVVTHAHDEGLAGAVAVAVAAAMACQSRGLPAPCADDFLNSILSLVPASEVASGIRRARDLNPDVKVSHAAQMLGNGSAITAQDTVPFVLWSAARNLADYEAALWDTVSGLGDMDTTCAMVGGIVAMYTGEDAIPAEWRRNREPLPVV